MKLDPAPSTTPRPTAGRGRRLGGLVWSLLLLSVAGAFLLGAYAGAKGKAAGVYGDLRRKLEVLRTQNVRLIEKAAAGALAKPAHLVIDINFNNYQRLVEQRQRAIAARVLTVTEEDYIPARIEHAGTSVRVRIRLKGDLSDHFASGQKWSFRVKTRGENTLLGMKQFSLHHPQTRNYIYEWLLQRALRREGVIGLRYEFVRVTLNGRSLGIYALEEHFEKRLVENNSRREGPIVRFSEDRLWQEWEQQKIPFPGARQNGSGSFLASDVDAFQSTRWARSEELRDLHDKAIGLLWAFQQGELPTRDVFDVDKMARYLALTDLLGAEHGARWHNVRFYYNPVTSRLEPIGFDGDAGQEISFLTIHMKDRHWSYNAWSSDPNYFARLFEDESFLDAYLRELWRVSEMGYLETLLGEVQAELAANLRLIYKEAPSFEFSPELLDRNRRYIRSVLEPVAPLVAYGQVREPTGVVLTLANLQALPLEVVGLVRQVPAGEPARLALQRVELGGRSPSQLPELTRVPIASQEDVTWNEDDLSTLRVEYRIAGLESTRVVPVSRWPFAAVSNLESDLLRRSPNLARFDFIEVDERRRLVSFRPGEWTISEDLVLPPDHLVRCGPGTRLHLINGAMLFSRSRLEFLGTADDPIVIDSPDATGQGLLVIGAPQTSVLENVHFRSLAAPARAGWSLTGAVTFYESNVHLSGCQFADNRAEDSLNLIRATFSIEDSLFRDTPSDAFDADFCRGTITRSVFRRTGNDAIDISGSDVVISLVDVSDAGDKAFSIGERSTAEADALSVTTSKIALAVKDSSNLTAQDIRVSDSLIALALYQKKPEFGPASARLQKLELQGVTHDYKIEAGSLALVDGVAIEANEVDLARQFEPAEDSSTP